TGWHLVQYNNITGWAMTSHLANIGSTIYLRPTTANVRIRSSASTSGAVIITVPKGATVSVQEEGGSWSRVSYLGHSGWMMSTWLGNITATKATPIAKTLYTTSRLNLRSGPSLSTDIVTK